MTLRPILFTCAAVMALGLAPAALAQGAKAATVAATAPAAAKPFKLGHTSWGDPDLQGIWTNSSITTLERQPGLPAKVGMTQAEAAAAEKAFQACLATNDAKAGQAAEKAGGDPGGYNSFWLDPGQHFGEVNGEYRTSWVVDPPTGKIPYSPQGLKQIQAIFTAMRSTGFANPEVRSLGERCIVGYGSTGGPPMLNVLYNNNYQIVQSPGYVTIVVEMNHDARVIRLNDKHLPSNITPWMGDSVGHWEGDTLVVETTNLNPGEQFAADVRHRLYLAPKSKVTERFKRVSDGEILYSFTVEEPTAYTQTWRGEIPMHATKGPIYEYACHEGNYALPGILAGARADEKKKSAPAAGGAQ